MMQPLVNINAERGRVKMSQEKLAAHLGVTAKTLRLWVDGVNAMPTDKLLMIAELFNCSTDYLLGMSDKRERG